ncbi:MAG: HypC/HybG/HupF family hydrogenase formation chaperone [Myxococcota bacterium]|jgi:hydrogenase expression/formation protein HypC|nr:HypC/HybG/HupF family hydrogenase formation chaperone [Myxococcota bacterium]
MCLAVPGKVIAIHAHDDPLNRIGTVDFQGNQLEISLALVPAAEIGSWVLVHAGYALELVPEDELAEIWAWLETENEAAADLPKEPIHG